MGKENPHRLGHGAGEMGNAGVGGDDKIEAGDERGRVGQVAVAARSVRDKDVGGQG